MPLLSETSVTIRVTSATVNSRTASASYLEKYSVVAIVARIHGMCAGVCVSPVGMTIATAKEGVRFRSFLS